MALVITEIFGYAPTDSSEQAVQQRTSGDCPFTKKECKKSFRDGGKVHGTCTVRTQGGQEVIICPNRLYAEDYTILRALSMDVFGPTAILVRPDQIVSTQGHERRVVAFGTGWGGEVRIPKAEGKSGTYSADWILAVLTPTGELEEFIVVEVQSMDTTDSYQEQWFQMLGIPFTPSKPKKKKKAQPNINWENVNKRIIPQLLMKGTMLQGEELCKKGLFFICPTPVYEHMIDRVAGKLGELPLQTGAITFIRYGLESETSNGVIRPLRYEGKKTTTVQRFRDAFNSTLDVPANNALRDKIQAALKKSTKLPKAKETKPSGGGAG
jgi:hypothetical protein